MKYTLPYTMSLIASGLDNEIPESTLQIINKLSSRVGAPNYIKTPVFVKKSNNDKEKERERRNKHSNRNKLNEEWNKSNANTKFHTTKIEKSTGFKKHTDDLRLQVNKLCETNCAMILDNICKILNDLDEKEDEFDHNIVGNIIFELASSNRFYSKLYAQLYSELSSKYDYMQVTLQQNITKYIELFDEIKYVDPNENYEMFCENNKINEQRKSITSFLVNLKNCNIVSTEDINKFILILLQRFDENIKLENKINEANEICENFCLLFEPNVNYEDCKINGMCANEYLNNLAQSKISQYKSFSNKTKFKLMDIFDI